MMAGIRGKDTVPEMTIRKALHRLGFRYRLHDRNLPGKPDMVFPKFHAVIVIHGCFWHGHNCHLFKWPRSRPDFWKTKIEGNRARDAVSCASLHRNGWRVLTLWECALKGRSRRNEGETVTAIAQWLVTGTGNREVRGLDHGSTGRSDGLDG